MAIVGNFLENIIDPMVIIVVDAILMAGCF
jgi:hypothetical protein